MKKLALAVFLFSSLGFAMASGKAPVYRGFCHELPGRIGKKCCYETGVDRGITGAAATADLFFASQWGTCTKANYLYHWKKGYALQQRDWRGGNGYADPCDFEKPMGALWLGLELLNLSSSNPPLTHKVRDGNILRWGGPYAYTKDKPHRTKPVCTTAYQGQLDYDDKVTSFAIPVLGEMDVLDRATLVLHEARHHDKDHNYARDRSGTFTKDTSWEYNGAWRYEVEWLAVWSQEAVNAPIGWKCEAARRADYEGSACFKVDPNMQFGAAVENCSTRDPSGGGQR
jgi:hypothetical protein